jgi:hypothetical protein
MPQSHVAVRRLYLRLLALVYLFAFASLWVQVDGLIGAHGILPAAEWLDALRPRLGLSRFRLVPTLCWISCTDGFLRFLCVAGLALSFAVFFEVAVAPALALLWLLYLSLTVVGQDFLSFQWDALLLEAGFLSIFLPPLALRRSARFAPTPLVTLWLLRWLLFRLMFSSGVVKLLSGDPTWRNLTALQFHYETQPLPNPIAWYAHPLPPAAHTFAAVQMFAVELLAPFVIFFFRWPRVRLAGVIALVGLQLAIAATGNYGFFNLLAIALGVTALDDTMLPKRGQRPAAPARAWPRGVLIVLAAVIGLLSSLQMAITLRLGASMPRPLVAAYAWTAPLEIANRYGLFAVMTTSRPEIVVEGSDDGSRWNVYEFIYKVGEPRRAPPFVAPHMPRLDWQMWFAALGTWEDAPWFASFEARLLEARPEVLKLLAQDPFGGRAPKFVRARLYQYRFSRGADGGEAPWWTREEIGPFGPTLTRGNDGFEGH